VAVVQAFQASTKKLALSQANLRPCPLKRVMRQQTLVPIRLLPQGFDPAAFSTSPVLVVLEEEAGLVFTRMRTTIDPLALSLEDPELLEADPHSAGFYVEQAIITAAGPGLRAS